MLYQSSAGSGKTFILTLGFLKIALRNPLSFRGILAVTFTNKASAEMKSRIISVLQTISKDGNHPMSSELKSNLGLNDDQLQHRAKILLTNLLHQYGRFSVLTIDSFFHRVIRSFTRELGIQSTFSIEMDVNKIILLVIDEMLADLGSAKNSHLRKWLSNFAEERINNGKPWDFKNDIHGLAKELFNDNFKIHSKKVNALDESFFRSLRSSLADQKKSLETSIRELAQQGKQFIDEAGGIDMFKNKSKGPAGLFDRVVLGNYEVSENRRFAMDDEEMWLLKKYSTDPVLTKHLRVAILPTYQALLEKLDHDMIHLQSITEVLRYLNTYGIISSINSYLSRYRDENDMLLISDLSDFIRLIIMDSESPFLFEKMGNTYSHFLIDEFQDTSYFQWNNFRPLLENAISAGNKSIIVGDAKQSIYRWRGGDWNLLNSLANEEVGNLSPQLKFLSKNWRSSSKIVEFNNSIFSNLPSLEKELNLSVDSDYTAKLSMLYGDAGQSSALEDGKGYVSGKFLPVEEGIDLAIDHSVDLVEQLQLDGFKLRDIAVLTRNHKEGQLMVDALLKRKSVQDNPKLRYDVVSSDALFLTNNSSISFLVSMLHWFNEPSDRIRLTEWFLALHEVSGSNKKPNQIFSEVKNWREFVPDDFSTQIEAIKGYTIFEMVEVLIHDFKLADNPSEILYIQCFQDAVLEFTKQGKEDLASFLKWWEDVKKTKAVQLGDDHNAIRVMTIHKSKGLEFPVVIIPFLNWKLDNQNNFQENIMWVTPPKESCISELPVAPVKYSKNMDRTYWQEEYKEERFNNFVDAVNLLYVGFTRPKIRLYFFTDAPKDDQVKHIGHIVHRILKPSIFYDQSTDCYRFGHTEVYVDLSKGVDQHAVENYFSGDWRLLTGIKSAAEHKSKQQLKGVALHERLAQIIHVDDPIYEDHQLSDVLSNEKVAYFFKDLEEVKIEKTIILNNGKTIRPDRLVKKDDKWFVIDFKSGEPNKNDREQVKYYISVLKRMGYDHVVGRLIYLDPLYIQNV